MIYKILVANGSSNLSSQVNNYLNEGWDVTGGVSVTNYYTPSKHNDEDDKLVFQYTQAIFKLDEQ